MKHIIFNLIILISFLSPCSTKASMPSLIDETILPTLEYIKLSLGISPFGSAYIASYVIVYPSGQIQQDCYKLVGTDETYNARYTRGEIPVQKAKPDMMAIDIAIEKRLKKELEIYINSRCIESKKIWLINRSEARSFAAQEEYY